MRREDGGEGEWRGVTFACLWDMSFWALLIRMEF